MDKNNKTRKQKRKIDDNCCNKNISSNSHHDETHNVVNENNETMNKLKDILDNSKTNYEKEVMALNTLKEAHIYCKIHKLSGQVTGALVENFINQLFHNICFLHQTGTHTFTFYIHITNNFNNLTHFSHRIIFTCCGVFIHKKRINSQCFCCIEF